jgi:predicted transcriptional regulator
MAANSQTKTILVTDVDRETWRNFRVLAVKRDVTASALLRQLLSDFVERHMQKQAA